MTSVGTLRRYVLLWTALLLSIAVITASLFAPKTGASLISEGFPSGDNLPIGSLVSIRNTVPTTLEAASTQNSQYLLGVVEDEAESLLIVGVDGGDVNVATAGEVSAFVSNVNGPIAVGDYIGASWIKGVGMKASTGIEQKLLGIAIEKFDSENVDTVVAQDIDTPNGKVDAEIGKINIRLFARDVGPEFGEDTSALEDFAQKLAGKDVAYSRVLAALILFIVSVVIAGIFLANAIHGSFISLGRNPLASNSVFNSLMQVSGVSISLILIGAVLAYIVMVV